MPLRKLYVELTSCCNLDCAACFRRTWTEVPRDMGAETFVRVVDFAARSPQLRTVVLGGIGEPTSSPLIRDALASFPGKELTITTNGVNLEEETLAGISRNASLVVISVDGMHETFGCLRDADLNSVLHSVRRISEMRSSLGSGRPRIEFQFVLSVLNAGELPDVIELAAASGVNTVAVSHLLPQDEESAPLILYERWGKEETKAVYDQARLKAMRRGVSILLPPLELKTERRCAFAAEDAAFVGADGSISPCYRFAHDGTEYVFGRKKQVCRVSFGTIDSESLESIWDSPAYAAFRRTLLENRFPSCPDCDLLDGCDMAADTESDCWANSPSCADCMWTRGFVRCP